ncbi:MAG: electron transfer flavoprotein subunit alpha/FixB family protein [Nitriliruptorales bacterium]
MTELLVLIDHAEGRPRKISTQMLTRARQLAADAGDSVAAAWLGPGAADGAAELGAFGAEKLYSWDSEDATGYVTLPMVEALEKVFEQSGAERLLFPSSDFYKDVASRLAIRLEAGIITDASGVDVVDGTFVVTKEVFGGQTITKSKVADGHRALVGVKPNAFAAEEGDGGSPEVVELDISVSDDAKKARVVETVVQAEGGRPDIAEAAIVVAGGRGLGDESGFELMGEFADALGAGLGASRAAADAGWIPHRHQIGQTGKTISPQLYIGCGISGAIQHRAGMQTSQLIVAINKDGEAPIFNIADFGVVGDLYKVVPKLIEEIKKRKGE